MPLVQQRLGLRGVDFHIPTVTLTAAQEKLHAILHKWYQCKGDECP